ncbi:MAG TPA: transglycosylase SLT domain-containing protein [Terriglobia bacterium]|nr:transglycosylase SLT domain-containing protein [Terriglobia bacterium]
MVRSRALFLLVAAAAVVGCGTASKRQAVVQPPVVVSVLEPLPLQSSTPLLHSPYAPLPDTTLLLIGQAEGFFNAGKRHYRDGDMDQAREAFDRALATLLKPQLDVQGDHRLKTEFDKLVEDIHGLEVEALGWDDAPATHDYEPAPIDSIADLTFPVDPRPRRHVGGPLPLVSNDYIDGVLDYFQGRGRTYVERVLSRAGLYEPIISEALRREGLPQDLIYMAGAESGFNPFALSRKGAKGIWQLMLPRAREYGLKKDRWVDEREDPEKSTQAAVRHLKDLYQEFGDWYLAMAAYNCGPANVKRAIEKTGYADFWVLRDLQALPTETQNYVPIILATAQIARDPKAYGFEIEPSLPLATDQVVVGAPAHLRLVAQLIGRPVEELVQLNPGLLRWSTPPNDPEYILNLPAGTKEKFEEGIARIPPDKRLWWRAHKVEEGETVSGIASKYRVSSPAIRQANQQENGAAIEAGSLLILPLAPGTEAAIDGGGASGPRRMIQYRIRRGDTLGGIAARFDVTPNQIRQWNRIRGSRIIAGKTLKLYVPVGPSRTARTSRSRRKTSPAVGTRSTAKKDAASSEAARIATPPTTSAAGSPAR